MPRRWAAVKERRSARRSAPSVNRATRSASTAPAPSGTRPRRRPADRQQSTPRAAPLTPCTSGTATIAVGDVSGVIDIPITDDTLDEPFEQFTVTLSAPANASIAQGTATVTITDDDLPPKLSMLNAASVTEGGTGVTTPMTY